MRFHILGSFVLYDPGISCLKMLDLHGLASWGLRQGATPVYLGSNPSKGWHARISSSNCAVADQQTVQQMKLEFGRSNDAHSMHLAQPTRYLKQIAISDIDSIMLHAEIAEVPVCWTQMYKFQ